MRKVVLHLRRDTYRPIVGIDRGQTGISEASIVERPCHFVQRS
jgi:hypothetical protein